MTGFQLRAEGRTAAGAATPSQDSKENSDVLERCERGARPWRLGRRIELGESHRAARGERRQGGRGAAAADIVRTTTSRRSIGRSSAWPGRSSSPATPMPARVIGATRSDKVKALVYVAALAPDEGETVADVFYSRRRRIRRRPSSRRTRTG